VAKGDTGMSEKAEAYLYRGGDLVGSDGGVMSRDDVRPAYPVNGLTWGEHTCKERYDALAARVEAIERGCYCHRGEDENHRAMGEMAGKMAQVLARLDVLDKRVFASDHDSSWSSFEDLYNEQIRYCTELHKQKSEMAGTIADLREKLEQKTAVAIGWMETNQESERRIVELESDAKLGALVRQMPPGSSLVHQRYSGTYETRDEWRYFANYDQLRFLSSKSPEQCIEAGK
jgi:hypothetical protein